MINIGREVDHRCAAATAHCEQGWASAPEYKTFHITQPSRLRAIFIQNRIIAAH